ncbi:hypothetical protein [Paenibacillus hexagrammi]|uniref:Uncharacterized protein n=1 Tax=Paenibacillus hexagrammi TaxID=2908839 RepID=A0ABY3SL25_9BACL|nr:hypothetical protein [Paenibacillus sp. YPD9-1]UJF34235.1 hypothetical protein L0M14_03105 [Paenibacillus sp. YPD9-1]
MDKKGNSAQEELSALLLTKGETVHAADSEGATAVQGQLDSLQMTVRALTRRVEELQRQLQEQFQLQHRRQEQMLAQFTSMLEEYLRQHQAGGGGQPSSALLYNELRSGIDGIAHSIEAEYGLVTSNEHAADLKDAPGVSSETQTYSRMKSYAKIRKRRKTFLEKLFE